MNLRIPRVQVICASVLVSLVGTAAVAQDAPVITNDAPDPAAAERLVLTEQWRRGGDDDEILFGKIIRVAVDEAGNLYALDAQLNHVEVFSAEGGHLRTLSREGDGPGEIREPADMIFLPDGTFGLLTRFPGRLTKLDTQGNPAGSLMIRTTDATEGGFTAVHFGARAGSNLVFIGNESPGGGGGTERNWYVGRYDLEGNEVLRYFQRDVVLEFDTGHLVERDILEAFLFSTTTGPDGRVYVAPFRHEYKIHVYHPDGALERVITRDFANRDRTDKEYTRIDEVMKALTSGRQFTCDVENVATTVQGLHVDSSGHLWVQHSRSGQDQADGVFKTYDVYDADGKLARQVSVVCEGDPYNDELFFLDDGRAVMITGYHDAFFSLIGRIAEGEEDADIMEIIVYSTGS